MGRGPAKTNRFTPLLTALRELHRLENESQKFTEHSAWAVKAAQSRDEQRKKVSKLARDVLEVQ